jgi:hypothetical protein
MSLIFDSFGSMESAGASTKAVRERYGIGAQVLMTEEDAQALDPFPGELHPPVVHVDRERGRSIFAPGEPLDADEEDLVVGLVQDFGGTYAGT